MQGMSDTDINYIVLDGTGWDWWVSGSLLDYTGGDDRADGDMIPFVSGSIVCWDAARYDEWEQTCFDYDDGKRPDMGGYDRDNPPTIIATVTADDIAKAAVNYCEGIGESVSTFVDEQMDAGSADCIVQIAVYGKIVWG